MKHLLKYLKAYKAETVLAPAFKMLEALLELFVPLVIKRIIDVGIGTNDINYILKMCILLGVFALVGLLFSVTAQFFAARAAVGFSAALRAALFRHIGGLSYTEIDTLGTSAFITRMTSDINQVQNGINLTLRLLLRSPFIVFGAMIMAFTVDTKAALTFTGTIPVLSVVVFAVMLACVPLYKTVQKKLDGVLSSARGNLNGARVLRAFGKEKKEIADFTKKNDELNFAQRKAGKISALMNPLTYIIINISIVILIYSGALRVNSGDLSQGAVVALYNYMSQILVELIKLANLIVNITKAIACGNRIQSVFDTSSSVEYPANGSTPDKNSYAIEFNNVSFTYKNAGAASLSNIDIKIQKGEKIGVIGATGSGKTTLTGLIPRFYDASEGEIKLFGNNVKSYTAEQLNSMVAVVPQKAVLFSGTIRENVAWGDKNADDKKIMSCIDQAQGRDIIESKQNGLDEYLEEAGKNLSGGQKQRLTIARALMKNAPILILDDSSSALDPGTDSRLRQAIYSLPDDPTVIIVSQRTSSVMSCDRIIVMDDGKAENIGTHEELLEKSEIYREIYNSLTGGTANG